MTTTIAVNQAIEFARLARRGLCPSSMTPAEKELFKQIYNEVKSMPGEATLDLNIYCKTGKGGGVDPHCTKDGASGLTPVKLPAAAEAEIAKYQDLSDEINGWLRDGIGNAPEEVQKQAIAIRKVIDKYGVVLDKPLTVYRGIDAESLPQAEVHQEKAFTSTTTNIESAGWFGDTVMELTVAAGTKVLPILSGQESEVLLPQWKFFKYTGDGEPIERKGQKLQVKRYTVNAFCPTGEGGGIDPTCTKADSTVPVEPGTTPVPEGHIRLYHYTGIRTEHLPNETEDEFKQRIADALRKDGIDISKAKGSTYGEPDVVWASTVKPSDQKVYAEFSVHKDDPRWGLGKPDKDTDPREYETRGWDVTFQGSIKPEELIAVHEPWHGRARYLLSNPEAMKEAQAGKFDYLLDEPEYGKAVRHVKSLTKNIWREVGSHTVKAAHPRLNAWCPTGPGGGKDNSCSAYGPNSPAFKKWFKDSKVVDKDGKPLVVYHGTTSAFDEFSYDYMGKQGTSEGKGFYFTTSAEIASGYASGEGGNVKPVYVSIQKPLELRTKTIRRSDVSKFIKELDPDGTGYLSNWGDVETEGYDRVLRTAVSAEYTGSDNDVDIIHSIINADGGPSQVRYEALRKSIGYDGIIDTAPEWGGQHILVIPLQPSQVKSAIGNRGTYGSDAQITNVATSGKYSSTQVMLPLLVAHEVIKMGRLVDKDDLAEDGREDEPHITVKYGLTIESPNDQRLHDVLDTWGPIKAKLGKTSIFEVMDTGSQRGGAKYDVVKIDVTSDDLKALNAAISDAVPHEDTYPVYVPHVTLAYVKPGLGKKYIGMDQLDGTEVTFDQVVFSSQDQTYTVIPLTAPHPMQTGTRNVYCKTGKGGGKDPTCKKEDSAKFTISLKTPSWKGESLQRIVERELTRLQKIPAIADLLSEHPVTIEINDEVLPDGGGLYEGSLISLSTKFNESRKFSIGSNNEQVDPSPAGTLRHELGHHLNRALRNLSDGTFAKAVKESMQEEGLNYSKSAERRAWLQKNISKYAGVNLEEAFCESFAGYTNPNYGGVDKQLPPKIDSVFSTLLKPTKNIYCKTGQGGGVDPTCTKDAPDTATAYMSARALRAKKAYNPCTKEKQRESDGAEEYVAHHIGAKRTKNNSPMDMVVDELHGVELKVLHDCKDGRVNMRQDSRKRKEKWRREGKGRTLCTVLIDNRDKFENGKHKDNYSGHHIYYSKGVGAFRLSTMTKVKNYTELKRLIRES